MGPGGSRRPRESPRSCKNHCFYMVSWKLAFGCPEPPKSSQRRPKRPPGRPKRGRQQPRGGPREAQEPPRATQGGAQGPQEGPGAAQRRPRGDSGEAQDQHTRQEETRAEKPKQEDTSGDRTREDKTRGKTRQQTYKRSSEATKTRAPSPVSNLLVVHLMHGSTLVHPNSPGHKAHRRVRSDSSRLSWKLSGQAVACRSS